jgi:hypothetical protein
MTASPEPTVTAAASDAPSAVSDTPTATPDVAAAVPEPVRMPAQSPAAQPAGQTDAELPPPQPVTARARHRSAPRKSTSPSLQISPGEGGAPSSDKPASQD